MKAIGKKVRMKLAGLDGNAFSLLGEFRKNARDQGWSPDEIKAVADEAMEGDYNHLLRTIMAHVVDRNPRSGFTIPELLVVFVIIGIMAALIRPVLRMAADLRMSKGAAAVQAETITSRQQVLAGNPGISERIVGFRLLPDPEWPLAVLPDGSIDLTTPRAYARTVPLVEVAPHRNGRAAIHTDGFPAGFTPAWQRLVLEEAIRDEDGHRNEPVTWWWNIRVGDVATVHGQTYTVCGPMGVPIGPGNPEGFVNAGLPGVVSPLDRGDGPAEWLYLVNQRDDDGDGYTDSGWDGQDNDLNGPTDEDLEWEPESWKNVPAEGLASAPYMITRRPVAQDQRSGGDVADKKLRPSPVVVDGLKSVLPVNRYTGNVDIVFDETGAVQTPSIYGRPTTMPFQSQRYFFWVAMRGDILTPPDADGLAKVVSLDLRTGTSRVADAEPTDVAGTLEREGR